MGSWDQIDPQLPIGNEDPILVVIDAQTAPDIRPEYSVRNFCWASRWRGISWQVRRSRHVGPMGMDRGDFQDVMAHEGLKSLG